MAPKSKKAVAKTDKDKKTVSATLEKPVTLKIKAEKKEKVLQKVEKTTGVALSPEKQTIIEKFQIKTGDTGSPEVQIALLSNRIEKLVSHLKTNPSDNHSRRGLLGIVSKRRRLLHYLETKDNARYKDVAKKIGLSK